MNAIAADTSPTAKKRGCYKCGRRHPVDQLTKRRTPSGGAIYTCKPCTARPRGKR